MGRKQHYHDLNDLMGDLDNETILNGDEDALLEDADLALLHQVNPDAPRAQIKKQTQSKKRGRKPKLKE